MLKELRYADLPRIAGMDAELVTEQQRVGVRALQFLAGGRQGHGACRPEKQINANGFFQFLDLKAERWLRHVQALGRSAKVKLLGNRDKHSQGTN